MFNNLYHLSCFRTLKTFKTFEGAYGATVEYSRCSLFWWLFLKLVIFEIKQLRKYFNFWFFTHPIWIEMKLFACLRTVIIGVLLLLSYACHHQFTTGTSHSLSFGLWCQMLLWMNKNPLGMWNNKEIQCVLIFVLCILLTNTIMLRNRKETWREDPFCKINTGCSN